MTHLDPRIDQLQAVTLALRRGPVIRRELHRGDQGIDHADEYALPFVPAELIHEGQQLYSNLLRGPQLSSAAAGCTEPLKHGS
jgi:hypothetical protein